MFPSENDNCHVNSVWSRKQIIQNFPRTFIEQGVRAQDDWARRRDAQPLLDRDALVLQSVHLVAERVEGHYDAVADEAHDGVAHYTGGDQMQDRLLLADDERVPRVVTALKTHDRAGAIGEHVDDGAFAFVAPLRPNDDYVSTHTSLAR